MNMASILDPFKGSRGPRNAPVMIIGEAYGAQEDAIGQAFVGSSGQLLSTMLREAGINEADCLFTNVINRRPADNLFNRFLIPSDLAKKSKLGGYKGLFPTQLLAAGLQDLYKQIELCKPKIIIALGNYALWALTEVCNIKAQKCKVLKTSFKNPVGIDTWRGSQLWYQDIHAGQIPVLPTYHPAGILRNWSWRHIAVQDLRRACNFLRGMPWHDTEQRIRIIRPTASQLRAWIDRTLSKSGDRNIVLDLETYKQKIHILGMKDEYASICIPFFEIFKVPGFENPATKPTYCTTEAVEIHELLFNFFHHPRVKLVGQNLLYDAQYLEREYAYEARVHFDTMIAMHLMFTDDKKSLDYQSSIFCYYYRYWKDDRKESLDNEDLQLGCEYNCLDLEYTYENWTQLQKALTVTKAQHLFDDKMELYHIVLEMMYEGVPVNTRLKQEMGMEMVTEMQDIAAWLEGAIPDDIKPIVKKGASPWYSSPQQLGTLLYDTLRLRPVYDSKTGARTVKKEALIQLLERYPEWAPLLNAITIYRSLGVYNSTFISSETDHDDRWRTAYNPAGTDSFRFNSFENAYGSGLNMQNIPRDREEITLLNALDILG